MSIREEINEISRDLEKYHSKKNINDILKLYTKIEGRIKVANGRVQKLRGRFDACTDDEVVGLTNEEFEEQMAMMTNCEIDNNLDPEAQIDEYKRLAGVLKSCVAHLADKKQTMIECDKGVIEDEANAGVVAKPVVKRKKKA